MWVAHKCSFCLPCSTKSKSMNCYTTVGEFNKLGYLENCCRPATQPCQTRNVIILQSVHSSPIHDNRDQLFKSDFHKKERHVGNQKTWQTKNAGTLVQMKCFHEHVTQSMPFDYFWMINLLQIIWGQLGSCTLFVWSCENNSCFCIHCIFDIDCTTVTCSNTVGGTANTIVCTAAIATSKVGFKDSHQWSRSWSSSKCLFHVVHYTYWCEPSCNYVNTDVRFWATETEEQKQRWGVPNSCEHVHK